MNVFILRFLVEYVRHVPVCGDSRPQYFYFSNPLSNVCMLLNRGFMLLNQGFDLKNKTSCNNM